MEYEVVTLGERTAIGLQARTNNGSPDMQSVIGGLWNRFYTEGIYEAIAGKTNGKALGVYMDYDGKEDGDYTIFVSSELNNGETATAPEGAVIRTLPAGRYAKFIVKGDLHQAVGEFWSELWKMELPRAYVCDFEEYQNSDMEQSEIHMYIGLKDE